MSAFVFIKSSHASSFWSKRTSGSKACHVAVELDEVCWGLLHLIPDQQSEDNE